MRIALITPGFSANEKDWCIPALLNLVRVVAQEHDVHVFTLRYPHTRATYRVYDATVHAFGGAEIHGVGRMSLLQRAYRRVRYLHRANPFDVIHGFWADEPGFVAVAAGRLTGVPAIVSVMGGELISLPDIGYGGQLGRLNRWLTSLALNRAAFVTVGSRYLERIALTTTSPSKLRRLSMGVDNGMHAPPGRGGSLCPPVEAVRFDGAPAILSVGSLVPVKDHDTLLRAFASVVKTYEDAHLHLVGDGPLRHDLEHLAGSLGLADKVTFHGDVRHERLPGFYRSADLLVISSRHESQSMVAIEGAACGCAVVGTAVGILPEISPISSTIQSGDAAALSEGVQTVLVSGEQRSTMISEALELARTRFSLDQTVEALLALYAEVIGSR